MGPGRRSIGRIVGSIAGGVGRGKGDLAGSVMPALIPAWGEQCIPEREHGRYNSRVRMEPMRLAAPVHPVTITELDEETLARLLPPWRVILYNDEHNGMDHVVRSLLHCVPPLTPEEAIEIMFTAHYHGEADVIACPKETAEHYRNRLEACGLTATIEPE